MNEPIFMARLTPASTGAIATIGLLGSGAWQLVEPLFRPRTKDRSSPMQLGRLGGDVGDEVVLVRNDEPTPCVEIHCHGGVTVVAWLLDLLRQRGAVEIDWQEWLRQTIPSRLQAEAAIALAHCRTLRTANILSDQRNGACDRALATILAKLREGQTDEAMTQINELLRLAPLGRHLVEPWRVVLAGAPNVGKSSLINAILGFQRSITSPIPGTTRDVVRALTAIDGWPVELFDTAGLRDQATGLEAAGIERAQNALATADLCLWILDRSQSPEPELLAATVREQDAESIEPSTPPSRSGLVILVVNKADLPFRWSLEQLTWPKEQILHVSAHTGEGLSELLAQIANKLVPQPPVPGAAVPFTDQLVEALQLARVQLLEGALDGAKEHLTL